ncbi:hypothetical protein DLJ47_18155 [Micromonospora sp. S4605]|nr:hypothetical protein DLJ47_18155 [Micromonospora sp. S4605]
MLVETTRTGQTRLVAPAGARRRPIYPTGVQEPCVSCAAAGRDTQGLPRDGEGSDPLCIPCWRSRTEREQRRAAAELRAAALEEMVDDVDQACAACGALEPSPACWLCGYSWLAAARAEFAAEQAAEAAAVEMRFAQLAECTEAEARVAELTAWVQRLNTTIEAFAAGGRRGRAVELLADLLHRDAAARASKRGRPSVLARVAGVLAVDAAARITRPGRMRTAELAGCAPRTVTNCWARAEALEWMVRTVQGRKLTLDERTALGRSYDRAEFDLAHLGGRDRAAARAGYLPVALLVLDELLQHAVELLQAAQDNVDALHARTGATMDMAAMARCAQLRQAAARARDTALADAEHLAGHALNICHPRVASIGMSVYSCWSRGFGCPPPIVHRDRVGRRTRRRRDGASRSPMRSGAANHEGASSPLLGHPRPPQRACDAPRAPRRTPKWAGWAYALARAVQARWTWLRPAPLPRVAATLGAALSDEWTAEALDDWVHRSRARSLLAAPRDPVAYLRAVLEDAFAGPASPPYPARRHTEHRRALVAVQATAQREHQDAARADRDDRDQAARAERAGCGSARRAALAAARAAARGDHATARAISAAAECDWPEVAQPGAGLPPGLGRP